MEKVTGNNVRSLLKKLFQRYFVDAMSAMALGLFSSLIIGLIMSQLSQVPFLTFLAPYSEMAAASSPVVGSAIGAAIAWGLKAKPLVVFSCVVCGAFGYQAGGPVGAYVAAVVGAEFGRLVSGKTKVDIVVTPMVTIITGSVAGQFVGPYIQEFMNGLGAIINQATELSPLPMGILVSVIVGMVLTAPISSAALCIMLDLSGLAAGAAAVGCSAQMIGFAVASFRENRWGGLLSQGIGTSMLQFSNIMKKATDLDCSHFGQRGPRPDLHLRVPDDQYRHRRGHGNQRPCRAIWRFLQLCLEPYHSGKSSWKLFCYILSLLPPSLSSLILSCAKLDGSKTAI